MEPLEIAGFGLTLAGATAGATYVLLKFRFDAAMEGLKAQHDAVADGLKSTANNCNDRMLDFWQKNQLQEREIKNLVSENEALRSGPRQEVENPLPALIAHLNDPDFDLWTYTRGNLHAELANNRPAVPVVSIINFKGGVGKTTLTSSLACYLVAQKKKRVLLIDLDYQGSLTNLCRRAWITKEERVPLDGFSQIVPGSWLHSETTADVLIDKSFKLDVLLPNSVLFETDYRFLSIENRSYLRWAVDPTHADLRLRLRRILASDSVKDNFDIVLIDCPPRLSLGGVNALFASSHYLVPSIFDRLSAEPVEFLLTQLTALFKGLKGPKFLGVVGMRTAKPSNWTGEENRIQQNIGKVLKEARLELGVFPNSLPDRVAFSRNAGQAFAYQVENEVSAWVNPIGDELLRRIEMSDKI